MAGTEHDEGDALPLDAPSTTETARVASPVPSTVGPEASPTWRETFHAMNQRLVEKSRVKFGQTPSTAAPAAPPRMTPETFRHWVADRRRQIVDASKRKFAPKA